MTAGSTRHFNWMRLGALLLTIDKFSFLLTVGAFLLTALASLLTIGAFLLTMGKCV